MLRATVVLAVLAVLPGCGSDAGGDGGPSDGGSSDAASGGGALAFELNASPALPGITADLSVDELREEWRDVRAIGDSAPGDSRTSIGELSLEWRSGDDSERFDFPQAPPGIYSRLEARLDRIEVRGHVRVAGVLRSFRVEGEDTSVPIGVDLGGLAVGAHPRTAVLALSLSFLASVRWPEAGDEEEIRIEPEDPQFATIEAGFAASLSLVEVR